jgi:hypothetical protein
LLKDGSWGFRGWTFQERFSAQRGVFIGEIGVVINCLHTYSPEDVHCEHTPERIERLRATGGTIFYSGQDKRCEPYIKRDTPFDQYAQIVYEYTQRSLTYQSDALSAFLGVVWWLEASLQAKLLHGLPDSEFDAALLWSPLAEHQRRPGHPSWSWLGWTGGVAWPWTRERDTFFSTEHSPLEWLDGDTARKNRHAVNAEGEGVQTGVESLSENSDTDSAWFTHDDLCLPASPGRPSHIRYWLSQRTQQNDFLGAQQFCNHARTHPELKAKHPISWPDDKPPRWKYLVPDSDGNLDHRLTFRTLSANFYVVGKPFQRQTLYNMEHVVWRLAVCDESARLAGYIEVPEPGSGAVVQPGSWKFVAMSRSTVDGNFEPPPDPLN